MTGLAFLDTETTGLDPDQHQIWEVGLIVDDQEYLWQLPVDLARADARALDIGRFHDRRWAELSDLTPKEAEAAVLGCADSGRRRVVPVDWMNRWCDDFMALTWGRHLVGAVVSFDEERLRKLLRANGACPGWHYHLIDVEALAVGFLSGQADETGDYVPGLQLPWDSTELSRQVGVNPDDFDKHTALGDARWAKALYEAVVGSEP